MIKTAFCGVAATAILAGAPACAQVGVSGLKLSNGAALTTSGIIQIANSSCGTHPSCDSFLTVTDVGTAALPQTNIGVNISRAIIRWSQFNIGYTNGANFETVEFNFNARNDIVINLVASPTNSATQINGDLIGHWSQSQGPGGNIWIINPAGVVFGANSVVNTGGLLATTSLLTNQANFLAGGATATFGPAPAGSEVQVGGTITGFGGTLAFIAPVVVTAATANITGSPPVGPCVGATTFCGTDVLYAAASAYSITFAPNAHNDLDLFSFVVPAGGGTGSTTPMTLAGTTSAGNVYIAAVNQAAVVGAVVAPGAITATTAGGSNGDIVLSAGGGLQTTTGEVSPVASPGAGETDVTFGGALSAGHSINLVGDGSLAMTSPATAGTGDVDITAVGPFNGLTATLSAPAGAVSVNAASFSVGSANALNAVTLTGTGAGADTIVTAATSATSNVDITGGGALNAGAALLFAPEGGVTVSTASFDVGSVNALDTVSLTGTGTGANAIATSATSQTGDLDIAGGGALNAHTASLSASEGSVTVNAARFDVGTVTALDTVSLTGAGIGPNAIATSATSQSGSLDITGGGSLDAHNATLTALAGNVDVNTAGFDVGSVVGLAVNLTGTGTGPSSIAVSATAEKGDLNIVTGGSLDAHLAALSSSAGNVLVSAGPNGSSNLADFIAIGQVTAGESLTLQGGSVSMADMSSAGGPILIRTAALSLAVPLSSDTNITVESTAGNLNLGDNVFDAPSGLNISNATFNNLFAPGGAITLYAGDPGNPALKEVGTARGDLTVGALNVDSDFMSSLVLLADNNHLVAFTGPVASFGDVPGQIVVGGAPLGTTAWTPGSIYVEAQSVSSGGPDGSIGTPDAPFASLTFDAINDVVLGTPGFIAAVGQVSGSEINVDAGFPPIPSGS
ncbi:MAG TPA: filamentous hemagglutinin N-terminal domain-containing protein, partial [Caulobacteraceae bacterium]